MRYGCAEDLSSRRTEHIPQPHSEDYLTVLDRQRNKGFESFGTRGRVKNMSFSFFLRDFYSPYYGKEMQKSLEGDELQCLLAL